MSAHTPRWVQIDPTGGDPFMGGPVAITVCEVCGVQQGGIGEDHFTAADRAGQPTLTEAEKDWLREITDIITGGLWTEEHDPLLFTAVERILRDRLPEATTVTEWGVHWKGDRLPVRVASEAHARLHVKSVRGTLDGSLVRRQVTRYADHYGPWEEVTDD